MMFFCDFSQVVDRFLMRTDLVHIQQLLFAKLKTTFRKASREGDAKMLETIVLTLGCLGKAAQGMLFRESLSQLLSVCFSYTSRVFRLEVIEVMIFIGYS